MKKKIIPFCPNCHTISKNALLGISSYVELLCDKCSTWYFIKTDSKGKIKTGNL